MSRIKAATPEDWRQKAGMAIFATGWIALMHEIARWVSSV